MTPRTILFGALALTLSITSALAAPAGVNLTNKMLVGGNGMTVYTFDMDTMDSSKCYGDCAAKWPPVLADAGDKAEGKFGIIDRTDGTKQVTYEGKPLYFWIKDVNPGDKTGDGVKGVWHIITE